MPQSLENAFKQFTLESSRLEGVYQSLSDQFKTIKAELQDTHIKQYGKIAELDFVTHYLGTILQNISQGILFIDLNGTVTTYNSAAEEILGFKGSDVLFHSYAQFFEDQLFGFSIKESLLSKKCPKTRWVTWKRPDYQDRELEIEAAFVQTDPLLAPVSHKTSVKKDIQGLLILVKDRTEFTRLQEQVNRIDRFKELGEMAARLAHEIRNPLGGIRGFAALLHQDLKDQPELQKLADQIVEGTDGLNRIISNILTYSRTLHPQYESVDLLELIQELLDQIKCDPKYHPNIICRVHSSLTCVSIPVDRSLIKSAFLNLLLNAIESMPKGGILDLSLQATSEEAIIKIQDAGVGISTENLDKLFSPFFTTKEQGNGLGLSEVQKIVQAHRGKILVSSTIEKGTEFVIHLPMKGSYDN